MCRPLQRRRSGVLGLAAVHQPDQRLVAGEETAPQAPAGRGLSTEGLFQGGPVPVGPEGERVGLRLRQERGGGCRRPPGRAIPLRGC